MKTKKNVINSLCGEVTTITTRLNKLKKFISKEFYNIDNTEREQILKERDIQIDYLGKLIQRIAYETELYLTDIKEGPKNLDGENAVKPKENTTDNKSKWVIYTDDPQFEGKTDQFKKYLKFGVSFTSEIEQAKKYDYYPALEIDINNLKDRFGIECFSKRIENDEVSK